MPTTVEFLSSLVRTGQEILDRLRSQYYAGRNQAEFTVDDFLTPFMSEIGSWTDKVDKVLREGFSSPLPSVTFTNAPGSPLRLAGTNIKWGNLVAHLESKLKALAQIVRDADPRSVVPLRDPKALFLVHGRNEHWNTRVEDYLQRLGLSVIVLEDQPNLGATLIEKFEANAEVGTAIVLFTADDVGCLKDDLQLGGGLKPRARQNVLIELGFFFGRLGRDHVCLLRERDVEIPSDLSGIVYTQIDIDTDTAWTDALRRELNEMGLQTS